VLSQVQDGQEHVIAYYSKTLNKAERNYCVIRRELLPIVRTLEPFHKYLYGQAFHLRTDHSALTWLMNFKNHKRQPAPCVQHLQEYNFTSEHRQDRKHKYVDALSRRPCQEECRHCHKVELRADIKQVPDISALSAADWDPLVQITEQLNDRHRAHSGGSRNWTTTGVQIHSRLESHKQKLLGPVEFARCKKRRTRAQLGIRQRTIQSSQNISPSEKSGGRADLQEVNWVSIKP
jgi:hypothetical protein